MIFEVIAADMLKTLIKVAIFFKKSARVQILKVINPWRHEKKTNLVDTEDNKKKFTFCPKAFFSVLKIWSFYSLNHWSSKKHNEKFVLQLVYKKLITLKQKNHIHGCKIKCWKVEDWNSLWLIFSSFWMVEICRLCRHSWETVINFFSTFSALLICLDFCHPTLIFVYIFDPLPM